MAVRILNLKSPLLIGCSPALSIIHCNKDELMTALDQELAKASRLFFDFVEHSSDYYDNKVLQRVNRGCFLVPIATKISRAC